MKKIRSLRFRAGSGSKNVPRPCLRSQPGPDGGGAELPFSGLEDAASLLSRALLKASSNTGMYLFRLSPRVQTLACEAWVHAVVGNSACLMRPLLREQCAGSRANSFGIRCVLSAMIAYFELCSGPRTDRACPGLGRHLDSLGN